MSKFLLVEFEWRYLIATDHPTQNEKTGAKPVFNTARTNLVEINPDF